LFITGFFRQGRDLVKQLLRRGQRQIKQPGLAALVFPVRNGNRWHAFPALRSWTWTGEKIVRRKHAGGAETIVEKHDLVLQGQAAFHGFLVKWIGSYAAQDTIDFVARLIPQSDQRDRAAIAATRESAGPTMITTCALETGRMKREVERQIVINADPTRQTGIDDGQEPAGLTAVRLTRSSSATRILTSALFEMAVRVEVGYRTKTLFLACRKTESGDLGMMPAENGATWV
jgi:hypothetical protein